MISMATQDQTAGGVCSSVAYMKSGAPSNLIYATMLEDIYAALFVDKYTKNCV